MFPCDGKGGECFLSEMRNFEGRPRQGKKLLPDWLSYIAGSSKSRREILISDIFLQSPRQVGMEKGCQMVERIFADFTTLEIYRVHVVT